MCNSRCLIIYPFPASQLNSSWWSYPWILPLIFNIAWSFNFFVGRKENHFTFLYHVFCYGDSMRHKWYAKKIVSLSNTAKKLQWDDLFKRSNVVTRHKDNSQRAFRQERSWVRNLLARNIFACCFIDNGCLCSSTLGPRPLSSVPQPPSRRPSAPKWR